MYKVGIILEAHGTVSLVIPLCLENPSPIPDPLYLLGIPPLHVVRFPSTLVPGCLCTDLPPLSFSPSPFSLSPTVPHFNTCPPTATSRRRLHIVRYSSNQSISSLSTCYYTKPVLTTAFHPYLHAFTHARYLVLTIAFHPYLHATIQI
jgi:hypothetical protein